MLVDNTWNVTCMCFERKLTEHFACNSNVNAEGIDLRVGVDGVTVDIVAAGVPRGRMIAGTAAAARTRNGFDRIMVPKSQKKSIYS